MIRTLIVDDEPLARRGIRQLLAPHRDFVVVGECRDGREAVRAIEQQAPDLVFLDVQMPELGGFDVLRSRRHGPLPAVIFVTAYEEYAVRAFETHALDYLVKPISEERFNAALARARERMTIREALAASRRLAAMLEGQEPGAAPRREPARPRRLIVPTATGELVLDADEIDWIQAADYYVTVHARGRRHLIRESLNALEGWLDPASFVRVHRSAIVRIVNVRELRTERQGEVVVLRDGTRIPVSRRRREQVARSLQRLGRG
ncbi:MAG: LytR/AlgR family response regulator transcription factor [Gemmatimonadaceae bacterium]